MRNISSSICVLSCLVFLFACQKDSSAPLIQSYSAVGLWIGTYHVDNTDFSASYYYSFDIKSDSTILIQGLGDDGNTYYGKGTWSVVQSEFTARATTINLDQAGVEQNITAVYDSVSAKLRAGTVVSIGNAFSATFELDRVN